MRKEVRCTDCHDRKGESHYWTHDDGTDLKALIEAHRSVYRCKGKLYWADERVHMYQYIECGCGNTWGNHDDPKLQENFTNRISAYGSIEGFLEAVKSAHSCRLGDVPEIRVKENTMACTTCGKEGHNARTCSFQTTGTGPTLMEKLAGLDCWQLFEKTVQYSRLMLLYGPPGTGKTTSANMIGVDDPQSVINLTLTEETPSAELRGHYHLIEGEFKWRDGVGIAGFRVGRRIVLNEIDKASGDTLQFCHALLDDPGIAKFTLPTGEVIYPEPGFSCIATMNGQPEDLPDAIQDRFAIKINIDKPHPKAIESLPEDLRKPAMQGFTKAGGTRSISIRGWKAFAMLREETNEIVAAKAVFGDRAENILNTLKIGATL